MIESYLKSRFITLYFLPFILGSLTVFSFQPFNFTIINFLILPICFYLVVYIKKKSKSIYRKRPFRINFFIFGTTFGFGFYLSGIHWIVNSLTFDNQFAILIPIALIAIPLFLSLFFSVAILISAPYLNLNISSIFLFSGFLAFSDFIRAKILTGFPWNLWAYSFSSSTEIIQILDVFGLFAFNLVSITIFMIPAILFCQINKVKKFISLSIAFFLLLTLYIYGSHSINKNYNDQKTIKEKINIKIISPNFKLEYGLNEDEIQNRMQKLVRYSDPAKNIETLFVWPEGVFSGYDFDEIQILKEKFQKNFDKEHLILFGVNTYDEKGKGFYNSLVIVNNQLEILREYKKQKLVPFGEFLPFENFFNKFGLKKITEGHGSFLKAPEQDNLVIKNLNILPLICYEIIFTSLVQKSDKNTNLIINISEDGWFGNSVGPYQHFAHGIFRAIEQNSFLLRSTNKGISAIINNKGEIVKKLNTYEAGNIELEVPLIKSNNKNKNDLIFFILLITYILVFNIFKKNGKQ